MKKIILLFPLVLLSFVILAQNPSAILNLESIDKGFLPPRMTEAQRDAIPIPAEGMIVYNTTTEALNIYSASLSDWKAIGPFINPIQRLSIGSHSFRPTNSNVDWLVQPVVGGLGGFQISNPSSGVAYAHIPLPAETNIQSVEFSYIDASSTEELEISIVYFANPQTNPEVVESFNSGVSFALSGVNTTSVGVNHTTFLNANYYVQVSASQWTNELGIVGVRIKYEMPNLD